MTRTAAIYFNIEVPYWRRQSFQNYCDLLMTRLGRSPAFSKFVGGFAGCVVVVDMLSDNLPLSFEGSLDSESKNWEFRIEALREKGIK